MKIFLVIAFVFIFLNSFSQDMQCYVIPNTERDSVINMNGDIIIYHKDVAKRGNSFIYDYVTSERLGFPGTQMSYTAAHGFAISSISFNRTLDLDLATDTTTESRMIYRFSDRDFNLGGKEVSIQRHKNGKLQSKSIREFMPVNAETNYWYYDFVQEFDQDGNMIFYRNIDITGNGFEYVYGKDFEIINMIQFSGYKPIIIIGDQAPRKMGRYYETERMLLRMRKN